MSTEVESLMIKEELLLACHKFADSRVEMFEKAIEVATSAAKEETKSSAGDKYETSRAMMHLEIEKNNGLLGQALKSKQILISVKSNKLYKTAQVGACVMTSSGSYYIAIGVGKVTTGGKDYMIISPMSPIGQLVIGLSKGDTYFFRNESHLVLEVI